MFQVSWILNKLSSRLIVIVLLGCGAQPSINPLPIYGEKGIDENGYDTDHTIGEFSFTNQNNETISLEKYKNTVFISDFFFTTCPSICPIMTKQLARVQDELEGENYKIISHTVNPEFDTENVLLAYSKEQKADLSNWDFVTGDKQSIYKQAAEYLIIAGQDTTQEIEFVHSEKLVLMDKLGRIRGIYDGTESESVDKLINDAKWLIAQ
jgi:protein SCO1/2